MSNQDVADIQALAEKMRHDSIVEESKKYLRLATMPSGRIVARCASCPKDVRDERKYGVWVFYSSTTVPAFMDALDWFAAHRATDIHRWYADQDSPPRFAHEVSTAMRRKRKRKQAARKEQARALRPSPLDQLRADLARMAVPTSPDVRPEEL